MNTSQQGSNDYIARLIKFKSRQFCLRLGLPNSEQDVTEHDLHVYVHLQMARHNPARGKISTFVDRIIDRWLISHWRFLFAEKRTPRREECSLNDPVRDCDGRTVQRHETTPEASCNYQRLKDLERDTAGIRERLPSPLKQIMDALGRGQDARAIARDLSISVSAVERGIDELRKHYGDAGMQEYL